MILSDGQGMSELRAVCEHIDSKVRLVIGVGVINQALAHAFPKAGFVSVPDENASVLWKSTEAAVSGDLPPSPSSQGPKVFLSHAVHDEDRLFPTIHTLREQFGTQVFVCADSVPMGSPWRASIADHLKRCDLFVLVASKASLSSVYCAFEMGMAIALKKDIRIVTLDGVSPPAFVSDIQAIDIERLVARKPWLDESDGLLDAMLEATQTWDRKA